MKISASIYSDKKADQLSTTVKRLQESHVDMIHVDCNDDLGVFADIEVIRQHTALPIDLHIITSHPERFYPFLDRFDLDYVTFQYENLADKQLNIPSAFSGQLGLAITSETPVEVFRHYADRFEFILLMATVPGKSGGTFDRQNFRKITAFQRQYPHKNVHVDGGVNAEVSFILRNMGVETAVSGSYLFDAAHINTALLHLKFNETDSHFLVQDVMRGLDEAPVIYRSALRLRTIVKVMDQGRMGCAIVVEDDHQLVGIIGNADLRGALLRHIDDLRHLDVDAMINKQPLVIKGTATVHQLLRFVKKQPTTVIYLPVVDERNQVIGIIHFMHLIKGEL